MAEDRVNRKTIQGKQGVRAKQISVNDCLIIKCPSLVFVADAKL